MTSMKIQVKTDEGILVEVGDEIRTKFPEGTVEIIGGELLMIDTGFTDLCPADVRISISALRGVRECLWRDGGCVPEVE